MRSIVCDPTRTASDASPKRWNVCRRSSATSGSSAGPLPISARPSTGSISSIQLSAEAIESRSGRSVGAAPSCAARSASNATPTLAVRAFHAGDVLAPMARHDQRPERVAKLSELRLERLELRQTRHAPSIRADHTRGLPAVAPSPGCTCTSSAARRPSPVPSSCSTPAEPRSSSTAGCSRAARTSRFATACRSRSSRRSWTRSS